MKDGIAMAFSLSVALTSCASQPKPVEPTSASTNQYDSYTCEQLVTERHRIQLQRIDQINTRLDVAEVDDSIMGVGVVLFWPAYLLGFGQRVAHNASYNGIREGLVADNEAVKQAALKKNCIGATTPAP